MQPKSLQYQTIQHVFGGLSLREQKELISDLMDTAHVIKYSKEKTPFEQFYIREEFYLGKLPQEIFTREEIERAWHYWNQIISQTGRITTEACHYRRLHLETSYSRGDIGEVEYIFAYLTPDVVRINIGTKNIYMRDVMQGKYLYKLRAVGWKIDTWSG